MPNLLIFLLAMGTIAPIEGSGHLKMPPARTTVDKNCGGFNFQWNEQGGKCGVCGDPWKGPRKDEVASGKYATGIITRNYIQGQVIDVTVEITANHGGWHSFYLCPDKVLTEECFQKYPLSDENGQTELPININKADHIIQVKLQLPPNLSCKKCVLRWKWVGGNRRGCENGKRGCCVGCGKKQEQFYGCSDIAVLPNGNITPRTTTKRRVAVLRKKPSTIIITKRPVVKTTPMPTTTTTKRPVVKTTPMPTTTTTKRPVVKTTPMPATTLPPRENPWKECPLTMKCTPTGPFVLGAIGTICVGKCEYQFCPINVCQCSCP